MNQYFQISVFAILWSGILISPAFALDIEQYNPHDLTFKSSVDHSNPFRVTFSAQVKAPNGHTFKHYGFFDGNGIWKIRIAPNHLGQWSMTTQSDDPNLDGKVVSFTCVTNTRPEIHGGLRIDPDHPRHFIYEDGTRYYLMGYECDWLWALDMDAPHLPTMRPFLDTLQQYGFNHLFVNAYAHDTKWREGSTGDGDYGPPLLYAWEGTNDNPDHSHMNLAYWQHYDRMMHELLNREIVVHIMIKVYNKLVNWPQRASENDDQFFRWMTARYAAFPNVVWDFSKEAHYEKDVDYKISRFKLIRETDPYNRLLTIHDDNENYQEDRYNDWVDFRSDQQHSKWYEFISRQREHREWPVVNVELGYEHGPKGKNDKTYGVVQTPEEQFRRGWEVVMGGGYPVYYYTYTAWDIIIPDHIPPGYTMFKRMKEIFESVHYWEMQPNDGLVSRGHCLAIPGKQYLVYLNGPKSATIKIEDANVELHGTWINLLTGAKENAGIFSNGNYQLTPPPRWKNTQSLLRITLH